MSKDVSVALVGAGRIARVHAAAYERVHGGRLTACTDPVTAAADALAEDFSLKVAPDLDALLADDTIDAVLVASPNALHPDQTIAALEAGKHVFCQKPIALTLSEADRVVAHAADRPQILQHGFMLRFTPPMAQLRQQLASGALGDPVAAQAAVFGWEPTNEWFYDPAKGGGVILDTLVHFGELILWLFGPAQSVHTEGGAYVLDGAKRYNSPDNATVLIKHTNGAVSSLYVSWTAGHGNFTVDVYGTEGRLGVDLVQSQTMRAFRTPRAVAASGGASGWAFPDLVWDYGYTGEQQYFVDRVAGRADGSAAATPAEARDALALVLAAQRSLDEKRTVTL
ncbi:Gfo/Idh/MocA family oxidoreductase [Streptomyces sp. NPDC026672]|uniref:Gfo/Idh/MocA family protein n=1 Tax=unclassified Streptomyces TaxID=2593676 RepID=UPI003406D354